MDKYDKAIAYLTEHPDEIPFWWGETCAETGCLFDYTGVIDSEGNLCGCLTQAREGFAAAPTEELTKAIRSDERIPTNKYDITVANLPVFAEWQRRLDKELGREG